MSDRCLWDTAILTSGAARDRGPVPRGPKSAPQAGGRSQHPMLNYPDGPGINRYRCCSGIIMCAACGVRRTQMALASSVGTGSSPVPRQFVLATRARKREQLRPALLVRRALHQMIGSWFGRETHPCSYR